MTSPPLDSTHGRTSSGMGFHYRLWEAHTVKRHWAWHDITAFGQHTRSNEVGHDMPSPPLHCTHGRTTSGVACHHRPLKTHSVERRRAWHDITVLGLHTWSDDVERGMTSPPSDSTHGRQRQAWHNITALGQHTRSTTLGVACHHRPWIAHTVERRRTWHDITALGQHSRSNEVGNDMPSLPLHCTHGRTTPGVACHHRS